MTNRDETILIVEDDSQILNFIAYTLKQEGFPYFTAKTAQGAMSTLVSQKIDLMILDMGLPDLDGIEVIRKVREWSEMPIIVVSARDQDKDKVSALDAGAEIDLEKRQVFLRGEALHVTPLEYNLLSLFFKNMGKVLTTQFILKEIYGIGYGTDTQALRALMAGLRRKIEPVPAKPRYILTEIGVGYRLVDE